MSALKMSFYWSKRMMDKYERVVNWIVTLSTSFVAVYSAIHCGSLQNLL